MPYSITNELNGLTVLSFGTRGGNVSGAKDEINTSGAGSGGGHGEQRRMIFNKPIASKMIVMVYGSQDGGGRGLIGGWRSGETGEAKNPLSGEAIDPSGQATYYNRNEATLEAMTIATGRQNVPCWVDGTAIVPNETAAERVRRLGLARMKRYLMNPENRRKCNRTIAECVRRKRARKKLQKTA
jgi:hypothetical protein